MRVLVVDDEDTIRGLIVQVLEDEGYEIAEASNAEEALQLFREKPFPLIVTDIYMGKMTGLDLLQEVKTVDSNSMVVVMTSNASLETATTALRAGAYDYLVKPFDDIGMISTVVNRAIEHYKLAADHRELVEQTKRSTAELERLNARFADEAARDGLTELHNRRHLDEVLNKEVVRARRHKRVFSLVFIDIDHFKNYNDIYGHLAGDDLLKSLAGILRERSRGSTEIVRYGGEEFLLLLPETGREGACVFAERLRRAVEEHPFPGRESQPSGKLTLSLGVATFPESGETSTELLDNADKALYQSKQRGRNIVSVWEHSLA